MKLKGRQLGKQACLPFPWDPAVTCEAGGEASRPLVVDQTFLSPAGSDPGVLMSSRWGSSP